MTYNMNKVILGGLIFLTSLIVYTSEAEMRGERLSSSDKGCQECIGDKRCCSEMACTKPKDYNNWICKESRKEALKTGMTCCIRDTEKEKLKEAERRNQTDRKRGLP